MPTVKVGPQPHHDNPVSVRTFPSVPFFSALPPQRRAEPTPQLRHCQRENSELKRGGATQGGSAAITVPRGSVSGANSARDICVTLAPSPGASANAAVKETFFGAAEVLARFTVPTKTVATGVEAGGVSNKLTDPGIQVKIATRRVSHSSPGICRRRQGSRVILQHCLQLRWDRPYLTQKTQPPSAMAFNTCPLASTMTEESVS